VAPSNNPDWQCNIFDVDEHQIACTSTTFRNDSHTNWWTKGKSTPLDDGVWFSPQDYWHGDNSGHSKLYVRGRPSDCEKAQVRANIGWDWATETEISLRWKTSAATTSSATRASGQAKITPNAAACSTTSQVPPTITRTPIPTPRPTGQAFHEPGELHVVFADNGTSSGCIRGGGWWDSDTDKCAKLYFSWEGNKFDISSGQGSCDFQGEADSPMVCWPSATTEMFFGDGDVLVQSSLADNATSYDHLFYSDKVASKNSSGLIYSSSDKGSAGNGYDLHLKWVPISDGKSFSN
jgi:hypothetical protein